MKKNIIISSTTPTKGHLIIPYWRNYSLTASFETHNLNCRDGSVTSRIFRPVKSDEADMVFLAAGDLLAKSLYTKLEVNVIFTSNLIAFDWLKAKTCDSKCRHWEIKELIQRYTTLLRANDFSSRIRYWRPEWDLPHNVIYGNRKKKQILPLYSDDLPF